MLKAHLHTNRGAQRDNSVGSSPNNSLHPDVPIPGAISTTKAFLISQRSPGAQNPELRIAEEGTLLMSAGHFPGLFQRSVSPCDHAWNPPRWVNTRAPLGLGGAAAWGVGHCGLGCLSGLLRTWGIPTTSTCVCDGLYHHLGGGAVALGAQISGCMQLVRLGSRGSCWAGVPEPHLSQTLRPCTISCIKSRVSLGEVQEDGWYLVS